MKFVIPQSTLNRIIARWLNENIGKVIQRDNTQALDHPPRFENTIYSKTGKKLFDVLLIQRKFEKISDETKKIIYVNYTDEVDEILKDPNHSLIKMLQSVSRSTSKIHHSDLLNLIWIPI